MIDAAASYRDFDADHDMDALRACILELQDHERSIYQRLPPGTDVVDDCIRHMFEQCERRAGKIILAELGGEAAGFVTVLTRMVSEAPDDGPLEYGLVSDLVVLGKYRGTGIGRRLMQLAEAHARANGVEWLRIGVIAGNRAAEHLYRSLGFTPWHVDLEKNILKT